jgi:hypothetical protein
MPTIKSNLSAVAARGKRRMTALAPHISRANRTTAVMLRRRARNMSKGTETDKSLREKGRPYAKRHVDKKTGKRRKRAPILPMPAHMLSRRSGRVFRGWRSEVSGGFGNSYRIALTNNAPHARALLDPEGTETMIPRRTVAKVIAEERPLHLARLREARTRALNTT